CVSAFPDVQGVVGKPMSSTPAGEPAAPSKGEPDRPTLAWRCGLAGWMPSLLLRFELLIDEERPLPALEHLGDDGADAVPRHPDALSKCSGRFLEKQHGPLALA